MSLFKKTLTSLLTILMMLNSLSINFIVFAEVENELIVDEKNENNIILDNEIELNTAVNNKYNFDSTRVSAYTGKISDEFIFSSTEKGDIKYTFDYDDKWFIEDSSYIYNHELAKTSLKMALATFGGDDTNLKYLYDKLNYTYTDNIVDQEDQDSDDSIVYPDTWKYFSYDDEEYDTIGFGIAYHNIEYKNKKYTIVSVAVRSAGYESEWASNFTVGQSGDSYGFSQAANHVKEKLIEYLGSINTPYETKLWITGYSRGAATANICGYYLDLEAKNNSLFGIKPEDIYTYTFETPKGKLDSDFNNVTYTFGGKTYDLENNIFNIVNNADLITKVVMSEIGFSRYGIDKNLPNVLTVPNYKNSTLYTNMINKYKSIYSYSGNALDDAKITKLTTLDINQNALFNCFAYAMTDLLKENGNDARVNYADPNKTNGQVVARLVMADLLTSADRQFHSVSIWAKTDKNTSDKTVFTFDDLNDKETNYLLGLVTELLANLVLYEANMTNLYVGITTSDYDGNNQVTRVISLTKKQYNKVKSYLTDQVTNIAGKNSEYFGKIEDWLACAHYPELCLSWMEAGGVTLFKNQRYVKYRVFGRNTELKVYYGSNEVASLDSSVTGMSTGLIESYIDDDDYLVVIVPEDANYKVKIKTNYILGSGRYAYISTYNVNNENVALKSAAFEMSRNKSYEIIATKDYYSLNGSTSALQVNSISDSSDVHININNDNVNAGSVSGSGTYSLYDTVNLSVDLINAPYEFNGWYDEKNRLISTSEEYEYIAEYDTTITAKWDYKPDEYLAKFINVTDLSATLSDSIIMKAYLSFDETKANKELAIVHYQIEGLEKQSINLTTLEKINDNYVLDIDLDAKHINSSFNIWFEYNSITGNNKKSSLDEYCDKLIEHYPNDTKLISLANAVKNYGKYGDIYFNNKPIDKNLQIPEDLKDYRYEITRNNKIESIIDITKTSLVLDSKISIKIYYEMKNDMSFDDLIVDVNISDKSRIEKGDGYIVIKDIKASELLNKYSIDIYSGEIPLIRLVYSPISYVYQVSVMNDNSYNRLQNLLVALYDYAVSANDYIK